MQRNIKIVRCIFIFAAIYGLAILSSMYFRTPPIMPKAPREQPEMYFGFIAISLAWQAAFLLIAFDPIRYRPLMLIAAVGDKLGFAVTLVILLRIHHAGRHWIPIAIVESLIGIAFLIAYQLINTREIIESNRLV